MLVLPQKITIKWSNKIKKWYIEKGYIYTVVRDEFEVDVLDLPINSNRYVEVVCDFCKKRIPQSYAIFNKRHKENEDCCKKCSGNKISKGKAKYTYEDVKREFENRNFTLLENEYKGGTEHHRYICNNGHENSITFKGILKGSGCRKCATRENANKRRRVVEQVIKIFEENNCTLLTKDYKDPSQKLEYICECGSTDYKGLNHFLRGQRCKKCGSRKLREANLKYDIAMIRKIFEEHDCVLLEKEFITSELPMVYICSCGRESKISLHTFLNGGRCRQCFLDRNRGENHPNWNPNLTEKERENGRNIEGYTEWRKQVYERDNYTCRCCGDNKGGNLNSHHLEGYDWCKEKRTNVDNGITLCEICHSNFHNKYGYGNNTKEQFEGWVNNK